MKDLLGYLDVLRDAGALALKAASLPREQREKYRAAIGEAYSVFDTALYLVVPRLAGLSYADDVQDLRAKAAAIDQASDWRNLLANIAQCERLRAVGAEMESWSERLKNELALRDPEALRSLVHMLLDGEWAMARLIHGALREPLDAARRATTQQDLEAAREIAATRRRELEDFHFSLMQDRQRLLQATIA